MNDGNTDDTEQFLQLGCIRITPPKLEFLAVRDGHTYNRKFTIQNVGKSIAFVRICNPTNKMFEVNTIERGRQLPSGLRIVRNVKLVAAIDSNVECSLPIVIDEQRLDYVLVMKYPAALVTINPLIMDLGVVNAASMQVAGQLNISNNGTKNAVYSIDLSHTNDLLRAEPTKGTVKAGESVVIGIRVVALREDVLETKIKVKCEHQVTEIPVKLEIIIPCLEAIHENTTPSFTLLDFPPTYYGLTVTKILFIRNSSASPILFAVSGELHNKTFTYTEFEMANPDFKAFKVLPTNGGFSAKEMRVFHIRFEPKRHKRHQYFYFCTVQVRSFRCGELLDSDDDDVFNDTSSVVCSSKGSIVTEESINSFFGSKITDNSYTLQDMESEASVMGRAEADAYCTLMAALEKQFVRIHLYGTVQNPSVEIVPDCLIINNMKIENTVTRVLELRNKSPDLPIIFQYKRTPYISLEENYFYLQPRESLQIAVHIAPYQLGTINTSMIFELVYYNIPKESDDDFKVVGEIKVDVTLNVVSKAKQPKPELNPRLTPNYIKEVGKFCTGLKFNSRIRNAKAITINMCARIDKCCADLVAFPNDTQQSLRRWTSLTNCRTIFKRKPRYIQPINSRYQLTEADQLFKAFIGKYYNNYIRQCAVRGDSVVLEKDYMLTREDKLLCRDFSFRKPQTSKFKIDDIGQYFLPLSPMQMNKIIVTPNFVTTGQIAEQSMFPFTINILNTNPFSIRMIIRSDKANIFFMSTNRYELNGDSEMSIEVLYKSFYAGYYSAKIDIIVNEGMILTVPVLANVVQNRLHIMEKKIVFTDEKLYKYIDISNKLNVAISFLWVIVNSNFTIEPAAGSVEGNTKITCVVRFWPAIEGPRITKIQVYTGDTAIHNITLVANIIPRKLILVTPSIEFNNIPLNEPVLRSVVVRNPQNYPVMFHVKESESLKMVTAYPRSSTVQPSCQFTIYLTATFTNCVIFHDVIKINVVTAGIVEVPISGNVVYPYIDISPSLLVMDKIPSQTTTSKQFVVKNDSLAIARVKFDMTDMSEYRITTSQFIWKEHNVEEFTLDPKETKNLYFHFFPKDSSSCMLYLPIVINNILGPPLYTDVTSTKVQYYLTDEIANCTYIPLPSNLPRCKVTTLSLEPKLKFSSCGIVFETCPLQRSDEQELFIANPQSVDEEMGIILKQLKHPFYLDLSTKAYKNNLFLKFGPGDQIKLTFSFLPDKSEFGVFEAVLPIVLKSCDLGSGPHTMITIRAKYHKPKISIYREEPYTRRVELREEFADYLVPMSPDGKKHEFPTMFYLRHHNSDCEVSVATSMCSYSYATRTRLRISGIEETLRLVHWITADTDQCFSNIFHVTCPCGGSYKITLKGCYESCYLTNYIATDTYMNMPAKEIAEQSMFSFSIHVHNTNPFGIRMVLRSDKSNIFFLTTNRYTLKGDGKMTIEVLYKSFTSGYYTSNIDLIVNEAMIITVPLVAYVVHKELFIKEKRIEFTDERLYKYLDITNNLNVAITFLWVVVNSNFTIEPASGSVDGNARITCVVRFWPEIDGPRNTTVQLYSGDSAMHKMTVIAKIIPKKLILVTPSIEFNNIPLNETVLRSVVVRNPQNYPVIFHVEESESLKMVTAYPRSSTVQSSCQFTIYIFATFTNCVVFKDVIRINVLGAGIVDVPMSGNVVYPYIDISPNFLNMDKIPAQTTQSKKFTIKNNSPATARIKFDMTDMGEYKITTSEFIWMEDNVEEFHIDPTESKILYFHFFPKDSSNCMLYLPIIINNILGPPVYTDIISTKVQYYLTDEIANCTYMTLPSNLPCCKITAHSLEPKLKFSKCTIVFNTVPLKRSDEYIMVITNPQPVEEEIGIRLKHLKHPFYLDLSSDATNNVLLLKLQPSEQIKLTFAFCPNEFEFGSFEAALPIIIRSCDLGYGVHTIITIKGKYPKPEIMLYRDLSTTKRLLVDENYVDNLVPSLPNGKKHEYPNSLYFRNHSPTCNVTYAPISGFCVMPPERIRMSDTEESICGVAWASSLTENCYKGVFGITCTCGGEYRLHIKGSYESCYLTNYIAADGYMKMPPKERRGSFMPMKNYPSYPLFPEDASKVTRFLNDCISTVECWMRTQIFFGNWYYQIPCGIHFVDFTPELPAKFPGNKKKKMPKVIPFANILITLVGPRMYSELGLRTDVEESEQMEYLYSVYTKALRFLREQGATITYIEPEFLLDYWNFLLFKKNLYNPKPPYTVTYGIDNIHDFFRLAKQSWLDVLLQTYKVLYLERVRTSSSAIEVPPTEQFFRTTPKVKLPNIISSTESMLLSWLEFQYNTGRHEIWGQHCNLSPRVVCIYGESLVDSLVFAATTARYCPYLIPFLQRMNLHTESRDERIHNANTIIKCWEALNYTFTMTAEDIVVPNAIRSIMFTAYLFQILPSMYPSETLNFDVGLSQSITEKVKLTNQNHFPIAYKAILISNNEHCFTAPRNIIVIKPNRTKVVSVTYFAKFVKKVQATLLLTGEIVGYSYATNKCIRLIGNPDLSFASTVIKFPQAIYEITELTFTIQSPYHEVASYELQQTYDEVHEPDELADILDHRHIDQLGCGRVVPTDSEFIFNSDGICKMNALICTLTNSPITAWLFFRNKSCGDFVVKVVTTVRRPKTREIITVNIPMGYFSCAIAARPRLFLEIPYQNRRFLSTTQNLLLKLVNHEEYKLWRRIIESTMGINIIERLITINEPGSVDQPFHCHGHKYIVNVPENCDVVLPETVTLPEECSQASLKVPFELKDPDKMPSDFLFDIETENSQRKRFYQVQFV